MRAAVRGIGWVTSSGWGRGGDGSLFSWEHGELPPLAKHPAFGAGVSRAGRLDEFTRLGFVAAALALEDAALSGGPGTVEGTVGAVAASTFGCLRTDEEYYRTALPHEGRLASPNLFAYTLPNCFLGEVAIRFGLTGTSFVVSETAPEGLEPLRLALETLAWGECTTVLAGVADLAPLADAGCPPCLPPGGVFLVLGEGAPGGPPPYGELSAEAGGALSWEGTPISSLAALVGRVLDSRR